MTVRAEVQTYIDCVYSPHDWVEWRCIHSQSHEVQRGWCPSEQLAGEVERFQSLNAKGFNVYVGANPRNGEGKTGDAEIPLCRTIFVDFDHLEGQDYDAIAMDRITASGLAAPTLRIYSGHGIHAYWRLVEPAAPEKWVMAQKRIIAALGSDPSIHNPERIMRLPGFNNVKDDPPVECFTLDADAGRVFDLDELLAHCPPLAIPEPVRPASRRSAAPGYRDDLRLRARALGYAAQWEPVAPPGRHNAAFKHTAQMCNDRLIDDAFAWQLLSDWNATNTPPLDEEELRETFRCGHKYPKRPPGNALRDSCPVRAATTAPPASVPEPDHDHDREPGEDPVEPEPIARRGAPQNTDIGGGLARQHVEDTIKDIMVDWPWPLLTQQTEMPAPGTVLALCGPPGSTKTFFVIQALCKWIEDGFAADLLIMEEDIQHVLARAIAQWTSQEGMTRTRWIKAHAEEARQLTADVKGKADRLGRHLFELPDSDLTLSAMADWIDERIAAGSRIIIVDPITAATQTAAPWIVETAFINRVKRSAKRSGTFILLVTHPKLGKSQMISLDSLAGSASSVRFCQGIIWLEAYEQDKATPVQGLYDPHAEPRAINRVVHVLKARGGQGRGVKIGYHFDKTDLRFREIGTVKRAKRKRKDALDDGAQW